MENAWVVRKRRRDMLLKSESCIGSRLGLLMTLFPVASYRGAPDLQTPADLGLADARKTASTTKRSSMPVRKSRQ
jgi:hypothetical protein